MNTSHQTVAASAASRILLDIRETEVTRGYHVLAAATILCAQNYPLQLHALTTGHPEEALAARVLEFDRGVTIVEWNPSNGGTAFDLYVTFAEKWPQDAATDAASSCSRLTLMGLTFPDHVPARPGLVLVNGHDTAAFAETIRRLLRCDV
jgi:hypothetical protein